MTNGFSVRSAMACHAPRVAAARIGVIAALLTAPELHAQLPREPAPSAAEVLLAQGRLDDAERELFAASSRSAREPAARGALGMFLASRGHLKVGATLLEEARQFGGDASVIDARLARIYAWLGDWSAVAALRHHAAPGPELDRERWLASHPPAHGGADSAVVAVEPNEMAGLGRITLMIGGTPIQADINPGVDGLVLPSLPAVAGASQQFGMREGSSLAVVLSLAIGALQFVNVPARLAPGAQPTIGLDVLSSLAPTFDPGAHRLTLHEKYSQASGEALPILLTFPGVRLVARAGQPAVAIESAAGRAALRGGRWTLDLKRGAIVAER